VVGDLDLEDCTDLQVLPLGLDVRGALRLVDCRKLITLPPDLCVGASLNLKGCWGIQYLPRVQLSLTKGSIVDPWGRIHGVSSIRVANKLLDGVSDSALYRLSQFDPLIGTVDARSYVDFCNSFEVSQVRGSFNIVGVWVTVMLAGQVLQERSYNSY
jgi:hypothetical protein